MPAGEAPGAAAAGKDGAAPKPKKAKLTRKEVEESSAAPRTRSQATRKRNLPTLPNQASPRKLRKRGDASAPTPTRQEVNAVFGSDAGSDAEDEGGKEVTTSPRNEDKEFGCEGGSMNSNEASAPSPHELPHSAEKRTGGTTGRDTVGRGTSAKALSSSSRAPRPLAAIARTGGKTGGSTVHCDTADKALVPAPPDSSPPATLPRAWSPLAVTSRTGGRTSGGTVGRDTAAKAPASSPPASTPRASSPRASSPRASPTLGATARTGGKTGRGTVGRCKAANQQASDPDTSFSLRASTPIITTAWPGLDSGAMLHGSTDNGEQDALSAALAAACAAVGDAASGALLSAVPPAMVAATATSVAATASDAAEGTTNLPHTHAAACFSSPLQGETALPLLSGATAAVLGLGDSNAQVAHRQIGPSHLSFFSSSAAFGDDASGPDGPQCHGAEFFDDGSAGGGGDSMVVQPGPGGFPAASAELASVDEKPVDVPPRFPPVEDAALQRTYAAERLAWRARFSEWGVS